MVCGCTGVMTHRTDCSDGLCGRLENRRCPGWADLCCYAVIEVCFSSHSQEREMLLRLCNDVGGVRTPALVLWEFLTRCTSSTLILRSLCSVVLVFRRSMIRLFVVLRLRWVSLLQVAGARTSSLYDASSSSNGCIVRKFDEGVEARTHQEKVENSVKKTRLWKWVNRIFVQTPHIEWMER